VCLDGDEMAADADDGDAVDNSRTYISISEQHVVVYAITR
jgi:hypothetical protein